VAKDLGRDNSQPLALGGALEVTASSANNLLPARKVWERYGVTDRTLDRWLEREELRFPRPVVVNRRRYFREKELAAWEQERAANAASMGAAHR
jgi:predicted DNA-binding transcriptional regulator AlpA